MFCDGGICSAQRNWETKHPAQSDSLKPRGCYLADQLERNDPPAIDSGIQDCLHLRCVPGHHDVSQQALFGCHLEAFQPTRGVRLLG